MIVEMKTGASQQEIEAVAAGADGLLIEVHPNPKEALVDGLQSLTPSDFARLMEELKQIAKTVGRYI